MKTTDTARLAFQSIQRYPLRTSMLLMAVAIGVTAVVMLTAVGEGARRYVTGEFTSLGTNLLIMFPGKSETTGSGIGQMMIGESPRDLTVDDAMALERSANVARVAPTIMGSGNASWRERQREINVLGTNAAMLDVQRWSVQTGRFLPDNDMNIATPVCVLGSVVREELFGSTDPLGNWLRIGDTRCRVIGVLDQGRRCGALRYRRTGDTPGSQRPADFQFTRTHPHSRRVRDSRRTGVGAQRHHLDRQCPSPGGGRRYRHLAGRGAGHVQFDL